MRMLMSPRMCVPSARLHSTPPASMSTSAFLIMSWPQIDGASERASRSAIRLRFASSSMFAMSAAEISSVADWLLISMLFAIRTAR